jgi:hypothetical protein
MSSSDSSNSTNPGWNVKTTTTVKLPLSYLIALITVAVSAAAMWLNLVARCQRLEDALTEERRVNNAQDGRFLNVEAAQADLPIIRNDMKWLLKRDEQQTRKLLP